MDYSIGVDMKMDYTTWKRNNNISKHCELMQVGYKIDMDDMSSVN